MKCELCQRVVTQDESQFADSSKPNTGMTMCPECAEQNVQVNFDQLSPVFTALGHASEHLTDWLKSQGVQFTVDGFACVKLSGDEDLETQKLCVECYQPVWEMVKSLSKLSTTLYGLTTKS